METPKSNISIIRGTRSRNKRVLIINISLGNICKVLESEILKTLEIGKKQQKSWRGSGPMNNFQIKDSSNHLVLVVDDLPDNVTMLCAYLRTKGYKTISANDGVEALEYLRCEGQYAERKK